LPPKAFCIALGKLPRSGGNPRSAWQDALELEHWLFVEHTASELVGLDARLLQTPLDRGERGRRRPSSRRESRSSCTAQTGSPSTEERAADGIVVVRGDAEDAHQYWLVRGVGGARRENPSASFLAARLRQEPRTRGSSKNIG